MKATLALLLALPAHCVALYDFKCNLYCYNQGTCKHGKGRFGSYGNVDIEEGNIWDPKHQVVGMYCECPAGYTGIQCEISVKVCGLNHENDNHICFNGNECVKDRAGNGQTYYHCECESDTVYTSDYVGKFCEHIATVFCGHKKGDDSYASSQFCTNGGKCLPADEDGTKHPGCECTDGWTGSHCTEKEAGDWLENLEESAWNAASMETLIGFLIFCAVVTLLCLGGLKLRDRRKKKRAKREREDEERYGVGFFPKRGSTFQGGMMPPARGSSHWAPSHWDAEPMPSREMEIS